MRGIPDSAAFMVAVSGITPAHAGNTKVCFDTIGANRDHPRACGEY